MNKYILAAVKRYREKDSLISPISKVDGEIITEIYEIFKKIGFDRGINILQSYKFKKDEEILDEFLQLNLDLSKENYESETEIDENGNVVKKPPPIIRYIIVNEKRIDLFQLIGYDSVDNLEGAELKYQIRLNPTPEKAKYVPYYANDILNFETKSERDFILNKMDVYLSRTRGYFLL